jgi:hypothetical protein
LLGLVQVTPVSEAYVLLLGSGLETMLHDPGVPLARASSCRRRLDAVLPRTTIAPADTAMARWRRQRLPFNVTSLS